MNPLYSDFTDGEYLKLNDPQTLDEMGLQFRSTFGYPTGWCPIPLDKERAQQHIQMIRDEFEKEFIPAIESGDIVETYDAGIDMLVYIQNALGEMGLPLAPGCREVFHSNMTKLDPVTRLAIKAGKDDPSGEPEGKTLKGPNYVAPQFDKLVGILGNEIPMFYVTPFEDYIHDDDLVVNFTCSLCDVDCLTSSELKGHALRAHHILAPNAWVKPIDGEVQESVSFTDNGVA